MKRVPAFVNAFAPLDPVIVACGAGAIALGFPVITNEDTFKVPKSLIVQPDVSKFNATSLEARDIKIKITNIDIPVAYASAFEGEIIRREDMQVEFDGSRVDCFELVQTKDMQRSRGSQDRSDRTGFRCIRGWIQAFTCIYCRSCRQEHAAGFRAGYSSVNSTAYLNCVEGVIPYRTA